MLQTRVKTAGRVAALAVLLVALIGPWTFDSHPSTEDECPPPLVWLGGGRCACRVSSMQLLVLFVQWGPSGMAGIVWLLFLLPLLPFLSTPLLLLAGERRWPRALHLAAWALVAALSAFAFVRHWPVRGALTLRLWGVWLCLAVAIAVLLGESVVARGRSGKESRPAAAGAG